VNTRSIVSVLSFMAVVAVGTIAMPDPALAGRGNGPTGLIYVESQELYYQTIGLTDLPPDEGPFQILIVGLDDDGNIVSAVTEYGPGDPEYVGGRWEAYIFDSAGDLVTVRYFECPLLGPGRESP